MDDADYDAMAPIIQNTATHDSITNSDCCQNGTVERTTINPGNQIFPIVKVESVISCLISVKVEFSK